MPAKLLKFPEKRKTLAPVGEPIELPSISIRLGDQVYTLAMSATITEQRSGGQPVRPAIEQGAPAEKR